MSKKQAPLNASTDEISRKGGDFSGDSPAFDLTDYPGRKPYKLWGCIVCLWEYYRDKKAAAVPVAKPGTSLDPSPK